MSDKSTKAEEPERSLTFQLQTGGTSGVRPSLAEMVRLFSLIDPCRDPRNREHILSY